MCLEFSPLSVKNNLFSKIRNFFRNEQKMSLKSSGNLPIKSSAEGALARLVNNRTRSKSKPKLPVLPKSKLFKDVSELPKPRGRPPGKASTPKVTKGVPCITLKINGPNLNPLEDVKPFYGFYLHYPQSKICNIDEVRLFLFYLP